ncbi:MAG: hypothetical protein JSV03_07995, partial [Planctomycetota bacterium]
GRKKHPPGGKTREICGLNPKPDTQARMIHSQLKTLNSQLHLRFRTKTQMPQTSKRNQVERRGVKSAPCGPKS